MLHIHYIPNDCSVAVSDDMVKSFALQIIQNHHQYQSMGPYKVPVSNELVILALRVLVRRKFIGHDEIVILCDGTEYLLNREGRFVNGTGFYRHDVMSELLAELM